MPRSLALAGIAASCLGVFMFGASAQDRVQVGVLECRGGASIGFIVGSVTNLGCVLRVAGLPDDREHHAQAGIDVRNSQAARDPGNRYYWRRRRRMAGMLYLPRLFVYHSVAEAGSKQSET